MVKGAGGKLLTIMALFPVGDNGQILRIRLSHDGTYPWIHGSVWLTYPQPFNESVVRNVTRYDDVDHVQGDGKLS
jgi:hypothetical protein